jgi:hypothetical protein
VPSMQQRLDERGERARAGSGQPLPVLRGVDVDSAAVHVGGVAGRPVTRRSPGMGSPQVSTGGGAAACETGRANSGERKRLEDNATQTQQLGRLAAAGRS